MHNLEISTIYQPHPINAQLGPLPTSTPPPVPSSCTFSSLVSQLCAPQREPGKRQVPLLAAFAQSSGFHVTQSEAKVLRVANRPSLDPACLPMCSAPATLLPLPGGTTLPK